MEVNHIGSQSYCLVKYIDVFSAVLEIYFFLKAAIFVLLNVEQYLIL